jgi:hypothetical protein
MDGSKRKQRMDEDENEDENEVGEAIRIMNEAENMIEESMTRNYLLTACPDCSQEKFAIQEDDLICLSCGYSGTPDEILARISANNPNTKVHECPECPNETLIELETSKGRLFVCLTCVNCWTENELNWCLYCGQPYLGSSGTLGACQECAASLQRKD